MKCEKCSMEATHRFMDTEGSMHFYCEHHATPQAVRIGQSPTIWKTYHPLIQILIVILIATFLMMFVTGDMSAMNGMRWFMGCFFLIFGLLKASTWKMFQASFREYDPVAKHVGLYAWMYPAIELTLAVMFLGGLAMNIASWITIVILGITTLGVLKSIIKKEVIHCACLGTWFNLPLGWATVIENVIMIAMAILMICL